MVQNGFLTQTQTPNCHKKSKHLFLFDTECMEEQLWRADYECSVCVDVVRRQDAIWSCRQCYTVFHLRCIKKWARNPSSAAGGDENQAEGRTGGKFGWRCPACQNVTHQFPSQYRCFCGKLQGVLGGDELSMLTCA